MTGSRRLPALIAVDSSALIAVIRAEPDSTLFERLLLDLPCLITWPTVLEVSIVLTRRRSPGGLLYLEDWLRRRNVVSRQFDGPLHDQARRAFNLYGKGGGHPAQLNFGDCMAYALAKQEDIPLLFKGDDFSLTDIRPALP